MKEVKLKSGSSLRIDLAPFADADDLLKTFLEEAKGIDVHRNADGFTVCKDMVCLVLSSRKIDRCIKKCMERALYNTARIKEDTWDSESAREDYLEVCIKVAEENLRPFTKNLSAVLQVFMDMIEKSQA